MDLHDVIIQVLKNVQKPLSVKDITAIIKKDSLWKRPSDGAHLEATQVSARVNNYNHLFTRQGGLVYLAKNLPEKRLLRITWNENNWELPSGHKWRKERQGDRNTAYENQYGYGAEEWLFNPRYNIDGYQYGYIRGLMDVAPGIIEKVYLFTIDQNTKNRYLVGTIGQIEVLEPVKLPGKVIRVFDKYADDMVGEIEDVHGDTSNFYISDFYPPVRFRMSDVDLYDNLILINEIKKGNKYNRFMPYIIEDTLEEFLQRIQPDNGFVFNPGKRTGNAVGHTRRTKLRSIEIPELHKQISKDIEQYLKPAYDVSLKNISIETTSFGGNIADVVLKETNRKFSIIEIKTSNNTRANIREAIGQLFDYALWSGNITIHKLVVVSPSELLPEHLEYFKRVKSSIKFNIGYWQYCPNTEPNNRFKKII